MSLQRSPQIFALPFAKFYPLYVTKAEREGRTRAEVNEVIAWLTGYYEHQLLRAIDTLVDVRTFFANAPQLNPNVGLIQGVVCGLRVENVANSLRQQVR